MSNSSSFYSDKKQKFILSPPAYLSLLYLSFILLGTFGLMLPFASFDGTSFHKALFTAVSAVTVTGLAIVDTGSHYTIFGQIIIAFLIQLGGLGLMTFSVLVLSLLGVPISTHSRTLLREDLNQINVGTLLRLVSVIFKAVRFFEIIGALILCVVFIPEFGLVDGVWHGIFHSISAFNNAGFALWPDSLMQWQGSFLVNITIPALFIIGGLGYSVIMEIWDKRAWHRLSLHAKLMLIGSGLLILFSFFFFALLEWSNNGTLAPLDLSTKVLSSWFQAVTTRTAGFNSLDIAALEYSTTFMMMPLMVIGGGSTSTAGGIKVTTLAIMLLAAVAFFKQKNQIAVFGKSIGLEEVFKAMAIITISLILIVTALFLLTATHDLPFLDIAFEVCSAFGTVGLSRGITGELNQFGQYVIMIVMFLGRVGPLALGFFLATKVVSRVRYPSERVLLG